MNINLKKIWQHRNILESFLGAFYGLGMVLKTERNAKIIFTIGIVTIIEGLILGLSSFEWIIIILIIGLVFVEEILNTIVENIFDIVKPQADLKVKALKDMSSGAVFISSLGAIIIGLIIFLPKIINLFKY